MRTGQHYAIRLPLIAVLVAGLACATAQTGVSAQTTQPAQQAPSRHRLFGALTSISADALVVTGRDGAPITVRLTSDTKIFERAAAHLADIQAGDRIRIVAEKAQDGALTALAVQDIPAALATGGRGGGTRELPSGKVLVGGSIVSVGETSLSVAAASGSATTVAVPSTARIQRLTVVPAASLSTGMRLAVQGTGNADGSVTASVILVAGKATP
jgi:uncharacterized protein DUF5666